jgi:hypothetical protein
MSAANANLRSLRVPPITAQETPTDLLTTLGAW